MERWKKSYVYVDSGNGHGSTNTKVRRYSNILLNVGTDITYADSAENGASFTINRAGFYWAGTSDYSADAAGVDLTITVNGSALTTTAPSITYAQGKRAPLASNAANKAAASSFLLYLSANDVVRPQSNGTSAVTDDNVVFVITRIN